MNTQKRVKNIKYVFGENMSELKNMQLLLTT